MLRKVAFLLGLTVLWGGSAVAETYYVAPLGAAVAVGADGSEGKPFPSLDAAFASKKIKGGDTLLLKDGSYGGVELKFNATFDTPVVIRSQTARSAHFDWIQLAGTSRKITLQNLRVWPTDPGKGRNYLVRAYGTTSDIVVDGLDIRSEQHSRRFMEWDSAKWNARKYSGILLEGPRSTAIRNRLMGVNFGISVGQDGRVISNVVNGFSGDALRAFDGGFVSNNRVFNCVQIDSNHADGFQSFAGSTAVRNLTISSNVIIEWTGSPSHPLRCGLQAIGLFDGPYDNLTITNNLVAVGTYHGISVYGARGAKIINNTVVNVRGQTQKYPWIMVANRKDGSPSTDVLVANNAAMTYMGSASVANRVEFRNNSVIGTPGAVFENPSAFDYRPRSDSSLINSADASVAPPRDMLNQKRPSGGGPDRGSYEVQVGTASASMASLVDDAATGSGEEQSGIIADTSTAKWIKVPRE